MYIASRPSRVGSAIRLERSETYWGRKDVALRSIEALPIENMTTSLNLYLSGDVDGSYTGGGTHNLHDAQLHYFEHLIDQTGFKPSQFGIYD